MNADVNRARTWVFVAVTCDVALGEETLFPTANDVLQQSHYAIWAIHSLIIGIFGVVVGLRTPKYWCSSALVAQLVTHYPIQQFWPITPIVIFG